MAGTVHSTAYERNAPDPRLIDRALHGARRGAFWLEDVGDVAAYPTLTHDIETDLLVVGGGYLGLWTAVLAKRRNPSSRVVLVESHTIGWAASGRNGGFCEASITHGEENGRSRWPEEYNVLDQLGKDNLDAIERDVAELGIDCQWERNGTLTAAVEEHQLPWLSDMAEPILDGASVRAEIDSPLFLGGVWSKDDTALVHPARLAKELARVASEMGVDIFEYSSGRNLESSKAGPVRVSTPQAVITAKSVALATNIFPGLLRRTDMYTVPVYDYVLMTEPLTSEQMSSIGWRNRQGLTDLANQFHYSRLTADNRILYGGYDAIYHAGGRIRTSYEDRPDSYRTLASHFMATFPQLQDVGFSHKWGGVIDTSTQFAAFYGLARQGRVAYSAGFTGLGVASTRFAAEVVLDLLSGDSTPRTTLRMVTKKPLPFPPEPLSSIGINLTRWSLDRADHREGNRNVLLRALDAVGLGFDS